MASTQQSEESCWLGAAFKVLDQARRPLHYTDIKRIILDIGLTPPGMKTTLEAALCREAQSPTRRVSLVPGQPGVFTITTRSQPLAAAVKSEPRSEGPRRREARGSLVKICEKYRRMKRRVKDMMFTNAAICDEVVRTEEKIARATEERRYLLRRVMQRQGVAADPSPNAQPPRASAGPPATAVGHPHHSVGGHTAGGHKFSVPRPPTHGSSRSAVGAGRGAVGTAIGSSQHQTVSSSGTEPGPSRSVTQSIAQLLGEVDKRQKKSGGAKRPRSEKTSSLNSVSPGGTTTLKADARVAKRSRPAIQTRRVVTSIPLDAAGRPVFPIELGDLVIYCLGRIVAQPGYHTPDHIFPVGFCSTRLYLSINQNSAPCSSLPTCLYTCNVKDGGVSGARFEISPEDAPGVVFAGATPAQCHGALLEAINASWGQGTVPVEPRGVEFFGLAHATVQHLIQSCVGARRCADYRWVKFESARAGGEQSEVTDEEDASVSLVALLKSGFSLSAGGASMNRVAAGFDASAVGVRKVRLGAGLAASGVAAGRKVQIGEVAAKKTGAEKEQASLW